MYHQTLCMRKSRQLALLVFILSVGSAFAEKSDFRGFTLLVSSIESKEVVLRNIELEVEEVEIKVSSKELVNFMSDMAQRESSNRHGIVNKFGYSGLYQFSKKNIRVFAKVSQEEFLRSPSIQRKAMLALMNHNRHVLRRQIKKYEGKVVHGVLVTESGLLASAHLAGAGNVRRWLRTGRNPKDQLGTSLTNYMKLFSGYNLQSLK